ncbi:MAG: hypothetical protein IBX68_11930 [Dehalococcoidia bacterium]|nr:hypothetical protein [Dehalococcoidia bacterium]
MNKNMQSVTIKADKPVIVISVEEYENMKETIALLTQYPDLASELRAERKKIEVGKYIMLSDYKSKHKLR